MGAARGGQAVERRRPVEPRELVHDTRVHRSLLAQPVPGRIGVVLVGPAELGLAALAEVE